MKANKPVFLDFRIKITMTTWLIGYQMHLHCCSYSKEVSRVLVQPMQLHSGNSPLQPLSLGGWPWYMVHSSLYILILITCGLVQFLGVLYIYIKCANLHCFIWYCYSHAGFSFVPFFRKPSNTCCWHSTPSGGKISSFAVQAAAYGVCWENIWNHSR